ncbi:MAG: response regulator transcription factor [Clostridiales bacterium]|nr:response regulator transcription factor [Clostridiales bacterium]
MKSKILLLEDDLGINNLITMQLQAEGYDVIQAFDGLEAINLFDQTFDLAILDVMVPIKDGFEVLEHIRKSSIIPIIFLTARNEDMDKMRALGLGADDYITKPFSIIEVIYRCKAHLRRYLNYSNPENNVSDIIKHGDICMQKSTFEATLNDESLNLSVKEFELLWFFIEHVGQVFTRQQLYEQVWDAEYFGDDNTIMVHISRIREKLGENPKHPKYIKTIKGLGYRMEKL